MSKGKLIVISGASGVGKGMVLGIMMKKRKDLSFSVSATTRPPRPGEIDGVHYYFISREKFEEMIAQGAFLEYDAHADNYYGTPRAQAEEKREHGPVLLDIEPAGDTFNIMESDREAREIANRREQLQRELKERTRRLPGLDDIARRRALGEFHELNLIVKGDVDGSIEALSDSLIKLSTPEVQVNVIHKAVGAISESDVTLAAASDAVIIGFQVRPSVAAKRLAENDGVDIRLYSIIYDAIEEIKDAMAGMLSPEIKEEVTGTAEVLQTYKISRVGTIAGCMVREGKIKRTSKIRLIRDGIVKYTGELGSLKRFKDDVKEVLSGYDCGLNSTNYNDIKEGDMIEAFEEVEVSKKL